MAEGLVAESHNIYDWVRGARYNHPNFFRLKGAVLVLLEQVGELPEGVIVTPEEREALEDLIDDILED